MLFPMTNIPESGQGDFHKIVPLFIKSYISQLKEKTKHFEAEKFVKDVTVADFSFPASDPNDNYLLRSNTGFLLRRKYKKKIIPHL